MDDGIWHATIPITGEHVFLHLLRATYLYHRDGYIRNFNPEAYASYLIENNRVPSSYIKIYRKRPAWWKFPRWNVEVTELGKYYCDYTYTYAKKIESDNINYFYEKDEDGNIDINKKIPNAAARFREKLPLILQNYGFSSRADYLVKWSIFIGSLGRVDAPIKSDRLNIFDHISKGISTREEADRTVCMPVEELM